MSDLGTAVDIHRRDGANTTATDLSRVRAAIESVRNPRPDRIGPYDHFAFRFGGSYRLDGGKGISVVLTEYSLGDEDAYDGLSEEQLLDRDRPEAERFAEELQKVLGEEYIVAFTCGFW